MALLSTLAGAIIHPPKSVPRNIKSSQAATKKTATSNTAKVSEEKTESAEKSASKPKAGLSNADFAKLFS